MTESLTLQGKRAQIAGGMQGATTVALLGDGGAQVLSTAHRPTDQRDDLFVAADLTTPDGCDTVAGAVHLAWAAPISSYTCLAENPLPAGMLRHVARQSGRRNWP